MSEENYLGCDITARCGHNNCYLRRDQHEFIKSEKKSFLNCDHLHSANLDNCNAFRKSNNLHKIAANKTSIICSVCYVIIYYYFIFYLFI